MVANKSVRFCARAAIVACLATWSQTSFVAPAGFAVAQEGAKKTARPDRIGKPAGPTNADFPAASGRKAADRNAVERNAKADRASKANRDETLTPAELQ